MITKTPYETAIEKAKKSTEIARNAFKAIGRMTPAIEKLIDQADRDWLIVDRMLGKK